MAAGQPWTGPKPFDVFLHWPGPQCRWAIFRSQNSWSCGAYSSLTALLMHCNHKKGGSNMVELRGHGALLPFFLGSWDCPFWSCLTHVFYPWSTAPMLEALELGGRRMSEKGCAANGLWGFQADRRRSVWERIWAFIYVSVYDWMVVGFDLKLRRAKNMHRLQ